MANSNSLENSNVLLVLFLSMHMFGWIGSFIILCTVIFAPRVQRHVVWLNLCVAWILACFSYSLLLITGQLFMPKPNHSVCLIQASAVIAFPSLAAGATLSLALHLWLQLRPLRSVDVLEQARVKMVCSIALVLVPYFLPVGLFFGVLVFGVLHPDKVVLAGSSMYCGVATDIPGKISAFYIAAIVLPTVILEGLVLFNFYKNRHEYRKASRDVLAIVTRLSAFTFFGIFAISVGLADLSPHSYGRLPNVLMALPPVSFVIIFGTQKDIVTSWMFWRRSSAHQTRSSSSSISSRSFQKV